MSQLQLADSYDIKTLELNIDKIKMQIAIKKGTTFFASLLSNLRLQITERVPTAATNGMDLYLNPYFIAPLRLEQLLGLVLHEVLHVVFDHILRCADGGLDKQIYNIAADHFINNYLTERGYELPDGGYCDSRYRGWSTMKIYKELMKNPPPNAKDFIMDIIVGKDGCGKLTDEERETIVTNIVKACTQAELSNDAGSIPGEVKRRLDDILNPKLPWNTILQNYASGYAKDDYSWGRPNRRFMPDFFLPSLFSDRIPFITAGADVSGSMHDEALGAIWKEFIYIWETLKPDQMRLMTFDTQVHLNKVYDAGDTLDDYELKGGGGTNVQPLLDTIRDEMPEFAIIFTDGYFSEPNMAGIATDVYWIIIGNKDFKPPHGVVIHFE